MQSALDMYWFHNDTPTVWTQIMRDMDKKHKLEIKLELIEQAFFLPEATVKRPVVLRGRCTLIVKRPLKIKEVVVTLDGFSYIRWYDRVREMGSVVKCPLTIFDSKKDSKSKFQFQAKEPEEPTTSVTEVEEVEVPQKKFKTFRKVMDKLHLSSQKSEPDAESKWFSPGRYSYNFDMLLHSGLPESTFVEGAIVRYDLKASVKCHSTLRGMYQSVEIDAVRCPAGSFADDCESNDRSMRVPGVMDVDFVIPHKGIALEDWLPVVVKFRGYNNTRFDELHVYLVEDVVYNKRNGTKAGKAPYRRRLLYPTASDDNRSDAGSPPEVQTSEEVDTFEAKSTCFRMSFDDGNAPDDQSHPISHTIDLPINLQMPKCKLHRGPKSGYMHCDTEHRSLEVSHFLEFDVWVRINDRPSSQLFKQLVQLALRSCYAHAGNAILPAYSQEPLPVHSSLSRGAPVSIIDHE